MAQDESARTNGIVPYPLAMVVCDAIWQDPGTRKFTLLGTFSTIHGEKFPLRHNVLAVFVSLTDGRGKTPIRLRVVDVDEERNPVFDGTNEVDFTDPRMVFEIAYHGINLVFPEPGEYRFQLFARDEPLMERRVLVIPSQEKAQ